jgi:hypothetical protein
MMRSVTYNICAKSAAVQVLPRHDQYARRNDPRAASSSWPPESCILYIAGQFDADTVLPNARLPSLPAFLVPQQVYAVVENLPVRKD